MTIDQKQQILKEQTHALESGSAAFHQGLSQSANPYAGSNDKTNLPLFKAWEFGWEQANLLRKAYGI